MMAKRRILIECDPTFKAMLEDIKIKRIKRDLDKRASSDRRLTAAIARHRQIWNDLEISKFIDDKKGFMELFNIYTFIVVAFLAVVLFGGMIFVMGQLNTTFHQIGINNDLTQANSPMYVNMTQAAENTIGQVNSATQALRMVAITLIFSLILATFVTNAMMKIHPAFFFAYVLIVFLAIILSAPVSNAYETLLTSNIYDGLLLSFTGANWILLNLPFVVAVTGILGGTFLFINMIRTGGGGLV